MPIIFGWGYTKRKVLGATTELECSNCGHKKLWDLINISQWFTLFFIPLFRYSNKYYLACPVCSNGGEVKDEKLEFLNNLIVLKEALAEGKITLEEFREKIGLEGIDSENQNDKKYRNYKR